MLLAQYSAQSGTSCFLFLSPVLYICIACKWIKLHNFVDMVQLVHRQGGNPNLDAEHRGVGVKKQSRRNSGSPPPKSEKKKKRQQICASAQIGDVELVKQIVWYFVCQLLV